MLSFGIHDVKEISLEQLKFSSRGENNRCITITVNSDQGLIKFELYSVMKHPVIIADASIPIVPAPVEE